MYLYYCILTNDICLNWETEIIEKCIEKTNMFLKSYEGNYEGIDFFCLLSLMKVENWDSWNDKDYDYEQTNYISIITSDSRGNIPEQSIKIMKKLSKLLSEDILLES